jgi:ADP-ribose pyrophosphatase
VVIVPYHVDKNKLVIIKEFRVPLGHEQYGFPAGLVDQGETIEHATARELYEETGLSIRRIIRVSPPIYSSSGMTDESISLVYVECQGEPSRQANMSSEEIHTLLVSPREASELCGHSNLKFDVKAWLVLSEYARTGNVF